jgi:uncharacterized protein YdaU (DUF1376 family)
MSFQFMPWYVGDYLKDTPTLSLAEHGAYLLLLGYLWSQKGDLPADEERLFRTLRVVSADEQEAVRKVVGLFFEVVDGCLANKRLAKELGKAVKWSDKSKVGAAKRWSNKKPKDATADATPSTTVDPTAHANEDANEDGVDMPTGMLPTPTPTQLQNPSETVVSGEPSGPPIEPENPADLIFGLGVGLLTRSGVADKQARAVLGKVRKTVGDEKAAALVAQASATVPALTDPQAWLMAAARGGGESEAERRMRLRREANI